MEICSLGLPLPYEIMFPASLLQIKSASPRNPKNRELSGTAKGGDFPIYVESYGKREIRLEARQSEFASLSFAESQSLLYIPNKLLWTFLKVGKYRMSFSRYVGLPNKAGRGFCSSAVKNFYERNFFLPFVPSALLHLRTIEWSAKMEFWAKDPKLAEIRQRKSYDREIPAYQHYTKYSSRLSPLFQLQQRQLLFDYGIDREELQIRHI